MCREIRSMPELTARIRLSEPRVLASNHDPNVGAQQMFE